jgi:hypothetical protein
MPHPSFRLLFALLILAGLAGCASAPSDTSVTAPSSEGPADSSRTDAATAAPSRSESGRDGEQAPALADKPATPPDSGGSRATPAGGDSTKLLAQLSDATRELATLRAANAKLKAETPRPAAAAPVTKADAADERLTESLKSYTQFKQEMANQLADIDRVRKDNAALNAQLKDALEQAQRAKAAAGEMENQLRAEKKSRLEADQLAAQLRDQLRTIARAVAGAGLNMAQLAAGSDAPKRSEPAATAATK